MLKKHYDIILEAVTWVAIIAFTIIAATLPKDEADSMIRWIIPVSALAAIFWYLRSRRLLEQTRNQNQKIQEDQKELRNSQKTIDLVFDNSADGILILNHEQQIEDFSPGMEKITGWKKGEIIGKSAQEILKFKGDVNNSLLPDVAFLPNSMRKQPYVRNSLITREGREIDVEASSTLIQESGQSRPKALVILRDVTYENELVRRDKEFIALTSHQLNTPLSIINGYISILKNKHKSHDKTETTYFDEIEKAVKRMISLTNNLLSISRIEQDKIKLEKTDVNIADLLHTLKKNLASTAQSKKVKLRFIETGQNEVVYADQDKLYQALYNIADNAIKYSPGGNVQISYKNSNGRAIFIVNDDGIGISREEISKIGEKFYRTQKAIDVDNQGTGLGLFITKTIIEKHNGLMEIKSNGKGAEFIVSLPTR